MPKNTAQRRIDSRRQNRSTTISGVTLSAPAGVSDHGALSGLADDDHSQYLLADGSRSLAGNLAVGAGITIDGIDLSAHAADPAAHHALATAGNSGISVAGQAISLAAAAAGAGLGYAAGVLAVGVANTGATGLTVEADAVRLTSSSNPGAAAAILASDASGYLNLVRLVLSDRLRTPTIDTASGNLTLQPAGDITIDPVGNDVLPATNYDINLGALSKKYLTLHAAELWVETLVAQNTIATIGGRILVGPTTYLSRDIGTGDTTIYVRHNQMVSGDRAYMEAEGKVEFFAITSGPTTISATEYRYTVTRNLDGSGANTWYAGDAMFNTGQAGNGFIDLYSIRGVKTASQAGPTIVGNVRNSSTYNDWSEAWAIGNLNGLYGYGANTVGVGLGKYASGQPNIVIDPTNGVRLRQYTTDMIVLAPSGNSYFAGVMTIGTAGEIRQGTGTLGSNYTGLRIWRDTNVGRIGGYANNVLQWYGDTAGNLVAGAGNVYLNALGITERTTQTFNNTSSIYPEVPGYSGIVAGSKLRFVDQAQSVWYGGSNYASYAGGEIGSLVASTTINADPLFPNSWSTTHGVFLRLADSLPYAVAPGYPSASLFGRVGVKHNSYELGLLNGAPYYSNGTVRTLWHTGNDGAGSGLDADTLDTYHAASFALLSGATFTVAGGSVALNTSYYGPSINVNLSSPWARSYSLRNSYAGADRRVGFGAYGDGDGVSYAFIGIRSADDNFHISTNFRVYEDGTVRIGNTTNLYSAKIQTDGNLHAQGAVTSELYMQVGAASTPGGVLGFARLYLESLGSNRYRLRCVMRNEYNTADVNTVIAQNY